jgi:hypothetical protein
MNIRPITQAELDNAQDDQDLQDWLDAQTPVIDEEHVRNIKRLQRKAIRSFEQQKEDFKFDLQRAAYAKAIGTNL